VGQKVTTNVAVAKKAQLTQQQQQQHQPQLQFIQQRSVVGNRDGKSWFNHDLINPFVID